MSLARVVASLRVRKTFLFTARHIIDRSNT